MIMGLFGASGMVPTNADVLLPEGFSEYTLTHEMGHVFDNNIKNGYLPATYNGGGLQMQWWLRWAVILIGVSRDFNVGLNDFQQTIFGTKLMWQDQMHGI